MTQSPNDIWQIGAETKGRADFDFFVTRDEKYGVYFSMIDEYGMMKFASPVQIWTDKQNPRLIFDSKNFRFEYQHAESCYYLESAGVIALLTPCNQQTHVELPYVLFDFSIGAFAVVNAPNFRLTEVNKGIVRLDLNFRYAYGEDVRFKISQDDGKFIDFTSLEWNDINLVDNVCSFVTRTDP